MNSSVVNRFNCVNFLICWCLMIIPHQSSFAQIRLDVSVDSAEKISMDEFDNFTALDCSDYLLGPISRVKYIPHIGIMIQSHRDLYLFDHSNLTLSVKYSRIGNASNEYTHISDFGYDQMTGLVYIYDMNAKKVLWFSQTGEFVRKDAVTNKASASPFSAFVRYNDSFFIGKRVYGMGKIPELSMYDNNLNFVKQIASHINLRSGIELYKQFTLDCQGKVLYNRYFSNEILEVSEDYVKARYVVDFGKYNIPDPTKYHDEYEILNEINSSKKLYSSYIHNICDSERYLSFAFISKPGKNCVAVYDKTLSCTKAYIIMPSPYSVSQVIPTTDSIYVIMEDDIGKYWVGILKYSTSSRKKFQNCYD